MRSQFDDSGGRPDVGEVVNQVSDAFRRNMRNLGPIIAGVVVLVLLATGIYSVGPGEQGVVRTFGRESGKTGPGLHYRFPFVQRKDVVNIEKIRRIEVGFRGDQRVPHEALMLTGDENIVEAQMIVQYRVTDPSKFLFRIRDPEDTLRATAEVALRSMVGRTSIDEVITTGREKVQSETRSWLQKLMDEYQSGISVTEVKLQTVDAPDEVKEAFHDVVRAREEKEKLINQAMGYKADLIPRARGEARKIEREAEGYKEQRVLRANGDASKFESVLAEYTKAERVTRERLYLETMERILGKIDKKVVVDKELAKGALPILQLGPQAAGAVVAGGK
ncbi:MAG TPA: FtsH protease activity modulator HflK [Polyangiaceae bacterium]|nr:FtsH protease activity modulator HflK [Polyangiaceae bacterium]HMR73790.1 FtsH protease activity modulator HflK [Polyangiaceae bacterium]